MGAWRRSAAGRHDQAGRPPARRPRSQGMDREFPARVGRSRPRRGAGILGRARLGRPCRADPRSSCPARPAQGRRDRRFRSAIGATGQGRRRHDPGGVHILRRSGGYAAGRKLGAARWQSHRSYGHGFGRYGQAFQLLKELLPGLSVAALVLRTQGPENTRYIEEARRAERDLGLQVQVLTVRDADDLARALDTAKNVRALVVVGDAQFTTARARIAELALKHRLPTMFTHGAMVEAGGLMSHWPDYRELYRQAADHVHKILQGAKPGDIPIEQPTRFEQVINVRTAKALGLTIPSILLMNATHVID